MTAKNLRPWRISNRLKRTPLHIYDLVPNEKNGQKSVAVGICITFAIFLCPILAPRVQRED